MPAMSVPVVRKMLDAVQGSAPIRRSVSGTSTPNRPDAMQAPVMASRMTSPSIGPSGLEKSARTPDHREARDRLPVSTPFSAPRISSLRISLRDRISA